MVFYVSVHCSHLHKFVGLNLSQSFNVDRSSLLIDTMITMRIVLYNFIQFFELKILVRASTKHLNLLKSNQEIKYMIPEMETKRRKDL